MKKTWNELKVGDILHHYYFDYKNEIAEDLKVGQFLYITSDIIELEESNNTRAVKFGYNKLSFDELDVIRDAKLISTYKPEPEDLIERYRQYFDSQKEIIEQKYKKEINPILQALKWISEIE